MGGEHHFWPALSDLSSRLAGVEKELAMRAPLHARYDETLRQHSERHAHSEWRHDAIEADVDEIKDLLEETRDAFQRVQTRGLLGFLEDNRWQIVWIGTFTILFGGAVLEMSKRIGSVDSLLP